MVVIFASGCISSESISSDYNANDSQPHVPDPIIDNPSEKPQSPLPGTAIQTIDGSILTVHFIDVGQGDSILIQIDDKNMLIDAGEQKAGNSVVSYLKENGVTELDVVVATHAHADHIGGMVTVLNNFKVKRFIDSGNPHTTKTYENMLIAIDEKDIPFSFAEAGQTISLDQSVQIDILNPGKLTGNLNDDSVVLKLTYGDVSFMFTGDAEAHAEGKMIAAGYDIDSDVLKVAHHGSRSSTTQQFLQKVNPEVCIIMVGTDNRYGHPHQEIIDRLSLFGCQVYRTDLEGNIVVKTDGKGYTIETQNKGVVFPLTTTAVASMAEA